MRWSLGCWLVLSWGVAHGASSVEQSSDGDAGTLYGRACEIASTGDSEAAHLLLRKAVEVDPDHAPARAELGHVFLDGKWRPADYAAKLAAYDPRQTEYREKLAGSGGEFTDHRRIARWTSKEGLTPETRRHWLAVLRFDPDHREALRELNAEWRDGELWDRDLAVEADERVEETARVAKEWEKRFARYEKRASTPLLDAIREELDGAAVSPIERRAELASLPQAARDLVIAFLEESHAFEEPEVTASLCRVAIFAPDEPIRRSAVGALASRPRIDVMPLLLSSLLAPIESESRIVRDRSGDVRYEHRVARIGDRNSREHLRRRGHEVSVRTTSVSVAATRERSGIGSYTSREAILEAMLRARLEGLAKQVEYQQEAEATDAWAETYNRFAAAHNERVYAALAAVSGHNLGDEPSLWWDAWRQETGYQVYDRPTHRTYEVSYTRESVVADPTLYRTPRLPPPPPPGSCECFVAGTEVWTRTGRKAIETLQPGELVLARDPQRGGLVYRSVADTTVRQPSPTYTIAMSGDRIVCTEGHPFWVIGRGWRMAKELRDGDVLSTIAGPTGIESIEEATPATAYNLIVEGAANYYVGESGVLVHDNTPRLPAVGLIAGR